MAEQIEAGIRDFLASHLSWLGEGLELVGTEYSLTDSDGSDGRIDILAKDTDRCYVIVEVKRSNKAARETFTEVFKYARLLQLRHHVRPSEVRIVVVSTVWAELRRAFAEFRRFVDYAMEGYQVNLGNDNLPSNIRPVPMDEAPLIRSLSPEQVNFLYTTEQRRDAAVGKVARRLKKVGVSDFVVALQQRERDEMVRAPYCACVALQRYPAAYYLEILQRHGRLDEGEDQEYFEQQVVDEDERLRLLEERVLALLTGAVHHDDIEIGYPEKFHMHLPKWPVTRIERFGFFAMDKRLDDTQIIEELCGLHGSNQFTFADSASSSNLSRVRELAQDAATFLKSNEVWAAHVGHALSALEGETRNYKAYVEIYCPENIVETLRSMTSSPETAPEPGYCVLVDFGTEALVYTGTLLWDGKCRSFDELLATFFHGRYHDYWLRHVHFGPNVALERRILAYLGVRYSSHVQELGLDGAVVSEDIVIENGKIKARSTRGWHSIRDMITGCPRFSFDLIMKDANAVLRM